MKVKFMGAGNKVIATFDLPSAEVGDIGVAKLEGDYYVYSAMAEGGGSVLFQRVMFREFRVEDAD